MKLVVDDKGLQGDKRGLEGLGEGWGLHRTRKRLDDVPVRHSLCPLPVSCRLWGELHTCK
ncbi:hypothetical protein DPMN_022278 [Dreissena polymorpha]|uniref:Uncharacterized protein n=1 Tax=Dreissena polymorpha TaxID=45954 RepID=A0A9D4S9Z1_DREPO|nr:hypothetical protein DPMN_022278 [Dreissena polymorpha]